MKMPIGWDSTVHVDPPEDQALQAIIAADFGAELDSVKLDGKIHRFKARGDTGREKSGWYLFFSDHIPAGSFGTWRGDHTWKWSAKIGREIGAAELEEIEQRQALVDQAREAELKKQRDLAAQSAAEIWNTTEEASEDHEYLRRKKVKNFGLHITGDGRLIMPVYVGDKIRSLQYISADGTKQFHAGGEVSGGYFMIPAANNGDRKIFICEGYATGASIAEATGSSVVIALNAGNLAKVSTWIRGLVGADCEITIVADHDDNNVGQEKAAKAAEASGAKIITPPETGDANDYAASHGIDALKSLLTVQDRWLVKGRDFYSKPAPIKWLIKHWIPQGSYCMTFGASGAGKSFVVIDWALHIAAQLPDWCGQKVRGGPVVYLAGEGQYGMKGRVAAWVQEHGVDVDDLYVSKSARDLNTEAGYKQIVQDIDEWNVKPVLIIVDTLNRFMSGDENKADEARTLNSYCDMLMKRYGCSVIVVHHTGVSADAKDRARGSSAFKGAMDTEIKIEAMGDGQILLTQTKCKDGELAPSITMQRQVVEISGWFDEDGDPVKTLVLEQSDLQLAEKSNLSKNDRLALEAYEVAAKTKGIIKPDGKFGGVSLEDWRDSFIESRPKNEKNNVSRTIFSRAKANLLEKREICIRDLMIYPDGDLCEARCKGYVRALQKVNNQKEVMSESARNS